MNFAKFLFVFVIVCCAQSVSFGENNVADSSQSDKANKPKIEKRSVSARVESAVGEGAGIRAKKVPGKFTIPKGGTANNFSYKFHDPKTGIKLDNLTGSSIYSVTEGRYMTEAAGSSDFTLPPGKYKFVVGGGPGAYGSLSFDVASGKPPIKAVDHKLPKEFGVTSDKSHYLEADGKKIPMDEINKDHPLKLHYSHGKLTGEHEATIIPEGSTIRQHWITTVDATLDKGVLSGTYVQKYTLSDLADPKIQGGFICHQRTMTGHLAGKVDESGLLSAEASQWTQKGFDHPYGSRANSDGTITLYQVKPRQPLKSDAPIDFTIEFAMQLPIQK